MRLVPLSLFLSLFLSISVMGQVTLDSTTLQVRTVAENLHVPWEVRWGPDDWLWLTERNGAVKRLHPDSGTLQSVTRIATVKEVSESGLLGMAFHPNFSDTSYVYLVYTYQGDNGLLERLIRYTYQNDSLINPQIYIDSLDAASYHDGARLIVTPERKLLMSTGDAGNSNQAQNLSSRNGKFLRLNLDGSIPTDNPFPNRYLWSWGHRNAQGLVTGPTDIIYSSEHGPATDDEINIIRKGRNYGWPDVKGFCDESTEQDFCNDSNVVEPLKAWTPTIAPCGLEYYHHTAIPEWEHSLLLVTLKESDLRVFQLNADRDSIIGSDIFFDQQYGRLRDVCVAPDGRIFISTSNRDGRAQSGFPVSNDDRVLEIKSLSNTSVSIDSNQFFTLAPNPFGNIFILQLKPTFLNNHPDLRLQLFHISGRQVLDTPVRKEREIIDVASFSKGVYLYKLVDQKEVLATGKLFSH